MIPTILRRFARTVLFGSSRADEREAKRRTTEALRHYVRQHKARA